MANVFFQVSKGKLLEALYVVDELIRIYKTSTNTF